MRWVHAQGDYSRLHTDDGATFSASLDGERGMANVTAPASVPHRAVPQGPFLLRPAPVDRNDEEAAVAAERDRLPKVLDYLEAVLPNAGQPLAGDRFGLADASGSHLPDTEIVARASPDPVTITLRTGETPAELVIRNRHEDRGSRFTLLRAIVREAP